MDLLWAGPKESAVTVVLAHSAGAAMDSRWMNEICSLLGDRGIRTARFEFAYMAARHDGQRRPPPRAENVTDEYRDAVEAVVAVVGSPVVIGGKSYGGRVASLVADGLRTVGMVRALVCLGYPFHPPTRPDRLRTGHLLTLETPTLICQGTRDPFGGADEVPGFELAPTVELRWFDGNHDVQPPTRLAAVADAVAEFALGVGV